MKVEKNGKVIVINDKLKDRYLKDLGYTEVKDTKKKRRSRTEVMADVSSHNNCLSTSGR